MLIQLLHIGLPYRMKTPDPSQAVSMGAALIKDINLTDDHASWAPTAAEQTCACVEEALFSISVCAVEASGSHPTGAWHSQAHILRALRGLAETSVGKNRNALEKLSEKPCWYRLCCEFRMASNPAIYCMVGGSRSQVVISVGRVLKKKSLCYLFFKVN